MTGPDRASAHAAGPSFTELLQVLPHRPPMVLLDALLDTSESGTACLVRVGKGSPFADDAGQVPCWVAVEYMAQCAAAHSGARDRAAGRPIRLGFLLGSRRVSFHTARFEPGVELLVRVQETWSDGELASFACTVRDRETDVLLAECELAAFSPHSTDAMEKKPR